MKKNKAWIFIIVILVVLFLFSSIIAGIVSLFLGPETKVASGNVALIPINGLIVGDKSRDIFGQGVVSSKEVIESIEKADKNRGVKAIILEINSPGGTAVASEEIVNAVKKVNKTTVSLIREIGTSGAYWIASASDYIIASRMSVTGSVGVLASYIEFAGLLERYNMSYQQIVGGKYKDIGSPLKRLTVSEKKILQSKIDKMHEFFIEDVVKNRKVNKNAVKDLSTGIFYLGSEAKELGLIDEIGGKDEVEEYLKKELNTTKIEIVEYKKEKTLFDILASVMSQNSFYMGKGIGTALLEERLVNRIEVMT